MPRIIYLGFNNLTSFKRGVENVIDFQSLSNTFKICYYLHWDNRNSTYRFRNLICIGIKKDIFWILRLNFILFKIWIKDKNLFIHSHNALMSIPILFRTNLLTVHDPLFYLMRVQKNKLVTLFGLLEKILYLRCNHIHFISQFAKENSLITSRNSFSIIFNTSHLEKVCSSRNEEVVMNDEFTNILIVRSIEERALIDLIISVANELKSQKYCFYVAGKGPLLNYYQKMVTDGDIKNVILLGYLSDVELINFYKNCSLILITALYGEGFGLPIIEGYLFNKPVIASNVCAIPEVIFSSDYLFENNVQSILSRLNFVRQDREQDFYTYYKSRFSNTLIISKFQELYSNLV